MYGYYNQNFMPTYQQPSNDERIWVQNQTSAEAYLVAPNGFVRLWDSNKPIFYEKRADATGRPMPLEAYSYSKIEQKGMSNAEGIESTINKEIEALKSRIEALEKGVKNDESDADDSTV